MESELGCGPGRQWTEPWRAMDPDGLNGIPESSPSSDMMGLNAWVRDGVGCSMGSIGATAAVGATIVAGCLGIERVHGNSHRWSPELWWSPCRGNHRGWSPGPVQWRAIHVHGVETDWPQMAHGSVRMHGRSLVMVH